MGAGGEKQFYTGKLTRFGRECKSSQYSVVRSPWSVAQTRPRVLLARDAFSLLTTDHGLLTTQAVLVNLKVP
jgi:hypothetical protein